MKQILIEQYEQFYGQYNGFNLSSFIEARINSEGSKTSFNRETLGQTYEIFDIAYMQLQLYIKDKENFTRTSSFTNTTTGSTLTSTTTTSTTLATSKLATSKLTNTKMNSDVNATVAVPSNQITNLLVLKSAAARINCKIFILLFTLNKYLIQ